MFRQNIAFDTWGGDNGKYQLKDNFGNILEKTPEETCARVARALADVEPKDKDYWYERFLSIMGINFAGGGRIMANTGAGKYKKETSPINCTVMRQIPDSMAGLMDVAKEAALTLKSGCGVGYDFSTIRPKGAYVYGAGSGTSGVISFMKIFDAVCSTVLSGGARRGAQMGCLDISSPEIEDFITEKRKDGALRYFNCSVLITDRFMNAVENDEQWDLWFWQKQYDLKDIKQDKIALINKDDIPYNHSNYNYFSFAENHNEVIWGNCNQKDVFKKVVYKTVNAKYLFDLITKSTYNFWEPGFILIDRMNIENNLYFCETIRATNPCQPGWATLLTPNGITTMDNVSVGSIIWSGQHWTKIINKICTGEKDVYAFRTTAGSFYGTDNHRVVSNGKKIEAKDADTIDICAGPAEFDVSLSKEDYNQSIIDGLVIGDGMVHKASNNKVILLIGTNDKDYFKNDIKSFIIKSAEGITDEAWTVNTTIKHTELPKTYNRYIPERYKFGDFNSRRSFLKGLYSANGSVVRNRITLKTSSFKLAEDVQEMLSSLGIKSYYTTNKSHKVKFSNGTYNCKESYDVSIGTIRSRKLFNKYIGFIQDYKNEKVLDTLKVKEPLKPGKTTFNITEKEFIGKELVYDITVDADEHTYWTSGLCVSNCGEQGLHPLTSCLLGSMILTKYVKNPFDKKSSFDFDKFEDDVKIATRALDNVVELNNLPIPEMQEEIVKKRRHGLGITGLGSTLNMLNISYGSDDSLELAEKIQYILAKISLLEGIELAKEKGCAPIFNDKNNRAAFCKSGFMSRLLSSFDVNERKNTESDILEYGIRFSHATSIAPTGTMSMSWGDNCSGGIEPVLANTYFRNIRSPNKKTKIQEEVFDYAFFLWKEKFGDKVLPSHWRTTEDLKVEDHIKMQSVMQKWCDSSISKTINVPADYPFEDFKKVYLMAWKLGLKGLTTYRPNPEVSSGVIIQKKDLENTKYTFELEDGSEVILNGSESVEYDGEIHNAANLFDALKEGIYGKM